MSASKTCLNRYNRSFFSPWLRIRIEISCLATTKRTIAPGDKRLLREDFVEYERQFTDEALIEIMLQCRWEDVLPRVAFTRRTDQTRRAFEALLLANDPVTAYAFLDVALPVKHP